MRRQAIAAAAVVPIIASLGACSAEAESDQPSGGSVPDGVAEQYAVLGEELDAKGMTIESGEWTVHLITEPAEPWYEVHGGGHSEFREPAPGETNHIEIIPVETATGRIVPDVPIKVEVLAEGGKVVQELDLNFYYSTFFHYANNFSIPEAGSYTVRATLGIPDFNRHGEAGQTPALVEGATVEFEGAELGTQ